MIGLNKLISRKSPEPDSSYMVVELQRFFRIVDSAWQPVHLTVAERWLELMGKRWGLFKTLDGVEIQREKMYTSAWQYLDKKRATIMAEYKYAEPQLKVQNDITRTEKPIKSKAYESIRKRFDKSIGLQILRSTVVKDR